MQCDIQALILDFGGVLSLDQDALCKRRMAERLRISAEQFHEIYWRHRPYYDEGASAEAYWGRVLQEVGVADHSLVPHLIAEDMESWTRYRTEVWDLALRFRAGGGRTAFLSNNVPQLMARIRADRDLEHWFDVIIASCEVGLIKPQPQIYQLCLQRLQLPPAACLFVDDRVANVDAAAALGMQTHLFEDRISGLMVGIA